MANPPGPFQAGGLQAIGMAAAAYQQQHPSSGSSTPNFAQVATAIPAQYRTAIYQAAAQYGIDPNFLAAILQSESDWNPNADSGKAYGLAQFTPGTAATYGVNASDPTSSIFGAAHYLADLYRQFGSYQLAAAAYNAGPGAVRQYGGIPPYAETQTYVQKVLGLQYDFSIGNAGFGTQSSGQPGYDPNNPGATPGVTIQNPVLSMPELQADYPVVYALVQRVPEIQSLFTQAVSQGWTPAKFEAAVQNSTWWKQNSDTVRQSIVEQVTDPSTWNQTVATKMADVLSAATQLGVEGLGSKTLNQLAMDSIMYGWDTQVLQENLARYVNPGAGGHFGGTAGTDEMQLRELANSNGIGLDQNQLNGWMRQVAGNTTSLTALQGQLRSTAAAKYPFYAQQINAGQNLSDLAAPYVSSAQNLLELGPGVINTQDPLIQQAMQYQDPVTRQPAAMPLWQFETQVRQRPEWQKTNNAQSDTMSAAHKVLTDFGFTY